MAASEADLVDLYPFNGGYSVMGVDAESAVGLLGLLLFIDLMRVHFVSHLYQKMVARDIILKPYHISSNHDQKYQ